MFNGKNINKGAYCTIINYTTLNSNLKRGILKFSEKISKKFNRPAMKFICNMIFGTLASKNCLLSEIGRNLNEKIPLNKFVYLINHRLWVRAVSQLSDAVESMPNRECPDYFVSKLAIDILSNVMIYHK